MPLNKDGQFRAKVAVYQQCSRAWSMDEVKLLKTIAERCWEAIKRARINRKLQEINETLEERIKKRPETLKTYQNQL